MRCWRLILVGTGLLGMVEGQQTKVNLGSQSKNVDFSGADMTKPVKMGTTLPATCSIGEGFFQSGVSGGLNLYGCAATNSWTLLSGVTVSANGTIDGAQSSLNLISGAGVVQSCTNNTGASRVDCTATLDTTYALSRAMDEADTDHSLLATSAGAGAVLVASVSPALTGYTQNQTFSLILTDANCSLGAT